MSVSAFMLLIISLYFLETSLLPGMFTADPMPHISILLLLTFLYQAWNEWIAGFLIFTLLLAFTHAHSQLFVFSLYVGLILLSYLLTQNVLGTRSISGYFIYAVIMGSILSAFHVLIVGLPITYFVGHFFFSVVLMMFAWSIAPIRPRATLSSL